MLSNVIRTALVALLLAASLPAGVCEALCEQPEPPPCHGPPAEPEPDADECPGCDQPATLSAVEGLVEAVSAAAAPFAIEAATTTPLAPAVSATRDPPGRFLEPYARSNRPLLS